jgi:hypothetical protein
MTPAALEASIARVAAELQGLREAVVRARNVTIVVSGVALAAVVAVAL